MVSSETSILASTCNMEEYPVFCCLHGAAQMPVCFVQRQRPQEAITVATTEVGIDVLWQQLQTGFSQNLDSRHGGNSDEWPVEQPLVFVDDLELAAKTMSATMSACSFSHASMLLIFHFIDLACGVPNLLDFWQPQCSRQSQGMSMLAGVLQSAIQSPHRLSSPWRLSSQSGLP